LEAVTATTTIPEHLIYKKIKLNKGQGKNAHLMQLKNALNNNIDLHRKLSFDFFMVEQKIYM
jgi:hypothetical protein